MQNIRLIVLGKLKEEYLRAAVKEYEKRLSTMCRLETEQLEPVKLPSEPSEAEIDAALKKEAEMIKSAMLKNAFTISMCIEGKQLSSEKLADKLNEIALSGRSALNIIIGSSFGLSPEIKALSDFKLSMSAMTFPHQLARVMLLEQIYRAYSINMGKKYHK